MSTQSIDRRISALLAGMLLCAASGGLSVSHAQVTSSGLGTVVNESAPGVFDIAGGTRPGSGANLFHSFGDFSLGTPDTANFLNDSGLATTNILGRVTGGNPSNLFGTINTTDFGGANLFLVNPAGIVFGPTAQLNVGGAFHATTADYIGLADGTRFNAVPSGADALLTAAAPAAFGFLTSNPAPISLESSGAIIVAPQLLSLVGGTINIGAPDGSAPGWLISIGGRVNFVSVASPGEAAFDGTGFDVGSFAQLGDINIKGGSIVDAREVFIRGGQLVVDDSLIFPGGFAQLGVPVPQPNGGEVNVQVTGDVTLTGTAALFGFTPGIRTWAGALDAIAAPTDAADITIEAGSVSVTGQATIRSQRFGPGEAAGISITADSVEVRNGGQINLFNSFAGPGGTITVNAQQVDLSRDGAAQFTGIAAQGDFHPGYFVFSLDPDLTFADGGTITINAPGSLSVRNAAQISTDSFAFGRSGDITVSAGNVTLSDGGAILAQSVIAGDSGNVRVNATGQVQIESGARISASTGGTGDGGVAEVTAGQSLTLSGDGSAIFSVTVPTPDQQLNNFAEVFLGPGATFADLAGALGLDPGTASIVDVLTVLNLAGFTAVPDLTIGDGGKVSVAAPQLMLTDNARIASSTLWDGNAGDVDGTVGNLNMSGGAAIRSTSGDIRRDTLEPSVGTGGGGTVSFTASDTISISGKGTTISTTTFGDGNAGNVSLSASEVNVQSGGSVTSESGGTLAGEFFAGTGNAGNISITTAGTNNAITVSGVDSTISTATFSDGVGGSIDLNANQINVLGGGSVTAQTGGTLEGNVFAGSGAGGSVTFNADDTVSISGSGSTVSVTTAGAGQGGDIEVTGNEVEVTSGGSVTAETSSTGNAGTIGIAAADLLSVSDTNSTVSTTTSGAGAGGDIALTGNEVDISGGGSVTAEASSTGDAGTIAIAATGPDTLTISGAGSTVSTTTSGAGAGGDIGLASAGDVNISNGGSVTAETSSTGDAGIIGIAAADLLSISGNNSTVSTTTSGAGAGGSILLKSAGNVEISSRGSVSADSLSENPAAAGATGDITIMAGNSITLSNGTISTQAAQADGGVINLMAPNIVQLTDSEITTSIFSESGANGGDINIDPETVVLTRSNIIANAFAGQGGNIQITANSFIQDASSVVQASSQFGVQGTVVVASPESDIAGSIAQLPQSIVDVSGLLPERCAARSAGGAQSSFVVAGRGGLPTNPDNYLPSFNAGSGVAKSGGLSTPGMALSAVEYSNQTTVAMAGWGCLR